MSQRCSLRFSHPERGVELAVVGPLLLLAGPEKNLAPLTENRLTLLVDDLDVFRQVLSDQGAVILEEPRSVPTGRNIRVRHPDGLVAKYVQQERYRD